MIFPDVTIEKWIKKYPQLQEMYDQDCIKCGECGSKFTLIRPYIDKDYIGFECDCTNCDEITTCSKPYSEEKIEMWLDLI